MSTMMTFEYLSQLCQNKDQVCSLPAGLKDVRGNKAPHYNNQIKQQHGKVDLLFSA